MLLAIITVITSVLGVIDFFREIPYFIVIGGMLYVLETLIGLITGELRSLSTTILSSMVSISVSFFNDYNIFLGWCLGLCVESITLSIVSAILMIGFAFMKNRKSTTDEKEV